MNTNKRYLYVIAYEIMTDMTWQHPTNALQFYVCAVPYLGVLCNIKYITDTFCDTNGREMVEKLLENLDNWEGDKAVEIKEELKKLLEE